MMDGAKYRDISEGNLFQSSRDLRLGRMFTFQQDNDPKHTAKATLNWFKGKHLNVLKCQQNPSNLKELEQYCLEELAKVPVARSAKLIETYPQETCSCNCCIFKVVGMLCKSNDTKPPKQF